MKKRFAVLLALLIALTLLPLSLRTASAEATSGQCGDNLYWSYSTSTHKLTITGSGAMWNYSEMDCTFAPWWDYIGDITEISLPSGLTTIGGEAFLCCSELTNVSIPDGVTRIEWCSFYQCESLSSITIPDSVTEIGYLAFYGCEGLTDVYYGGTAAQRNNIEIDESNEFLTDATWHYSFLTITGQPKAATVKIGANATFKVTTTGATGYQWQYSKDNGATWTNWSGKTSNSLTVTGSATNNGCFYRCLVSNASHSMYMYSGWARLTVSDAKPMVLTQPANVTTTLGKNVTFKVVVGGTGKNYQWQYSKNNGASWTNWSGKTKSSVTVTASETNNGCLYRCVIKNSYGTVWSKCARLKVSNAKPMILVHPTGATVELGKSTTFKVVAGGSGLWYQWYYSKNGGTTWTKWYDKTKNTLSVPATSTNNGTLFRCEVSNDYGYVTSKSAKLTVKGAPTITTHPTETTAAVGKNATFKVAASGSGLSYQWEYKKNDGETWTKWSGKTSASVTVKASATNNGCIYRCVVKNSKGTVWSRPARLIVSGVKPVIYQQPTLIADYDNDDFSFRVGVAGTGLKYRWQYLDDDDVWKDSSDEGYNTAELHLTKFEAYNYRCIISNSCGSVTSKTISFDFWD